MSLFFSLYTLGSLAASVTVAGCVQTLLGTSLLHRFRRQERASVRAGAQRSCVVPPVTVLKPLHGDEPLLEQALESFCTQDYPHFQIVFGVQSAADPAIAIVRRLQQRHPSLALDLIVDPASHGVNHKISNLINMMRAVNHETLVISDSDIHVTPDYLRQVVAALDRPGVGLVTTLYAGLPASNNLVRQLSACQINHNFLPGVMLSRYLGRQDCLGATMALTRARLASVGGLEALAPHVADDAILGRLIRAQGLSIAIANCMTWTTVAEPNFNELLLHEVRWGRTVKTLEPAGYAASSIQLPLFWALVTLLALPHAAWTWWMFGGVWAFRAACAFATDRALGQRHLYPLLLLPFRDWLSAFVMVASATGKRVEWRGHTLHLARHTVMTSPTQQALPGD